LGNVPILANVSVGVGDGRDRYRNDKAPYLRKSAVMGGVTGDSIVSSSSACEAGHQRHRDDSGLAFVASLLRNVVDSDALQAACEVERNGGVETGHRGNDELGEFGEEGNGSSGMVEKREEPMIWHNFADLLVIAQLESNDLPVIYKEARPGVASKLVHCELVRC
jgi:hypothetical protein